MSDTLRILCILGSVSTFAYFFLKVRKEQVSISDTIFWLVFSLGLVVLGVFPRILMWTADKLGILSPVNGLFLAILFIVLMKLFSQTVKLSAINRKLEKLMQDEALRDARTRENDHAQ